MCFPALTIRHIRAQQKCDQAVALWMPSCHTAACVRVALRAGQRCGTHSNWICQNSLPVNVVRLLGKAAAHDLQLSKDDQWLYLLVCSCCCCCCAGGDDDDVIAVANLFQNTFSISVCDCFHLHTAAIS